jgi:hypothetical protein
VIVLVPMLLELPPIVQKYMDASNAHDVKAILACFADDAVIRDENETYRGRTSIEGWLVKTIEQYNFQFRPLHAQDHAAETVVTVKILGTFPGSPVKVDYYFALAPDKILSLTIDS